MVFTSDDIAKCSISRTEMRTVDLAPTRAKIFRGHGRVRNAALISQKSRRQCRDAGVDAQRRQVRPSKDVAEIDGRVKSRRPGLAILGGGPELTASLFRASKLAFVCKTTATSLI
jgi:hypothetical protein